jgi:hypothetical protein
MNAQTRIGPYTVELEKIDDSVHCYITQGRFHASLQCAQDTGVLEDNSTGHTRSINEDVLNEIEAWAVARGW